MHEYKGFLVQRWYSTRRHKKGLGRNSTAQTGLSCRLSWFGLSDEYQLHGHWIAVENKVAPRLW